jgi:MFS family permease
VKPDFWKFFVGETISNFGNSVTQFALPLIVFKISGSAVALGAAAATFTLPHLFFGLAIGAWTDRTDRKRLMIAVDILQAIAIASVPLAAMAGLLSVGWIIAVVFVMSMLGIFFQASEFGAIPSLVGKDDLVAANGRVQASFAAASIVGPFAAGAALALMPVEWLLYGDAASFLVSAFALALIRVPFNAPVMRRTTSLRQDIVEGLRYVLGHPVLRNISLMMAMINVIATTTYAQLVLFAKKELGAADSEVGVLFAAGGAGVLLFGMLAGPLRRRWSFGNVALGALMLSGLLTIALAYTPSFLPAAIVWGASAGLGTLFNINTGSLRQAIVPNHMLGRVISIAMVLAWSANPIGAIGGGILVERIGDVRLVYAAIGALTFLIALVFRFASPLGHAERYLEQKAA